MNNGGYQEPRDYKCYWEKRVMQGIKAERVERSSTLIPRTGNRQSVVKDKLEAFMQKRSSLRVTPKFLSIVILCQ